MQTANDEERVVGTLTQHPFFVIGGLY